ncbi:hypothetical protein MHYP_G00012570 [Metynnis hypsauchen]
MARETATAVSCSSEEAFTAWSYSNGSKPVWTLGEPLLGDSWPDHDGERCCKHFSRRMISISVEDL